MSRSEADTWEARYRDGASYAARPSTFVLDWLPRLNGRPGGRALDVACGLGATAIALAQAGYAVDAVDIAPTALRRAQEQAAASGQNITWTCADLAEYRLPVAGYDLIVNIQFVNRDLAAQFADALAPGGWVLFEQHLRWPQPVAGPSSPRFRLRPGELRHLLWPLDIVHYEEGLFPGADPDSQCALARAVARQNR